MYTLLQVGIHHFNHFDRLTAFLFEMQERRGELILVSLRWLASTATRQDFTNMVFMGADVDQAANHATHACPKCLI